MATTTAPTKPHPTGYLPKRQRADLESAFREYIAVHNEAPEPFVWARTADQLLDSIADTHSALLLSSRADLCHEPLGQETR